MHRRFFQLLAYWTKSGMTRAHALHNAIIPSVVEKFRRQEPAAGNSIVAAMGGSGGLMSYGTNLSDVPLTRIR